MKIFFREEDRYHGRTKQIDVAEIEDTDLISLVLSGLNVDGSGEYIWCVDTKNADRMKTFFDTHYKYLIDKLPLESYENYYSIGRQFFVSRSSIAFNYFLEIARTKDCIWNWETLLLPGEEISFLNFFLQLKFIKTDFDPYPLEFLERSTQDILLIRELISPIFGLSDEYLFKKISKVKISSQSSNENLLLYAHRLNGTI